jgi:hypothetical protein
MNAHNKVVCFAPCLEKGRALSRLRKNATSKFDVAASHSDVAAALSLRSGEKFPVSLRQVALTLFCPFQGAENFVREACRGSGNMPLPYTH